MQTENKTKRRRTEPAEVRRKQLIEATLEVLAENGVSGTTMAAVTKRAGLSLGIVSLHFQSKDNLLKSTLRYLAEEIRQAWLSRYRDKTLSASERLYGIVGACLNPNISSETRLSVWFAFFGESRYRQSYRDIVEDFDDERTDAIEALCEEIITEGGYNGIDAESLATTIECLCDGLWLNMILYPEWLSHSMAKDQILDLLNRYFPQHFDSKKAISPR